MPDATPEQPSIPPSGTVGSRLRAARERAGLSLGDIAERTRIPLRHLETIEASDYQALPSPTYAVGFARAYAREVDLDEVAVAREMRSELDATYERPAPHVPYDTTEPARVPSGGVAIGGVVVALLLLIGIGLWYGSTFFGSGDESQTPVASETPAISQPAPMPSPVATPQTGGQVTLIATGEVWVRIYDADDKTLMMKTMEPGERYQVPQDADHPMINVGRPDKLEVQIDGSDVAPLGTADHAIKGVGVSADALRARGTSALSDGAVTPSAATNAPATTSASSAPSTKRATIRPTPTPTSSQHAERARTDNEPAPKNTPTPIRSIVPLSAPPVPSAPTPQPTSSGSSTNPGA